jgi:hypothetical protein
VSHVGSRITDRHEVVPGYDERAFGTDQISEDVPDLAPDPIPAHGRAHLPGEREGEPDVVALGGREMGDLEPAMTSANGIGSEAQKGRTRPNRTDQADNRALPRWRRAFTMDRPARVDMRCRKPCFFARLRTLG